MENHKNNTIIYICFGRAVFFSTQLRKLRDEKFFFSVVQQNIKRTTRDGEKSFLFCVRARMKKGNHFRLYELLFLGSSFIHRSSSTSTCWWGWSFSVSFNFQSARFSFPFEGAKSEGCRSGVIYVGDVEKRNNSSKYCCDAISTSAQLHHRESHEIPPYQIDSYPNLNLPRVKTVS